MVHHGDFLLSCYFSRGNWIKMINNYPNTHDWSMGQKVYLPTWKPYKSTIHVGKIHQSHGWYGKWFANMTCKRIFWGGAEKLERGINGWIQSGQRKQNQINPIGSMYGMHEWLICTVNVSKYAYAIRGSYGKQYDQRFSAPQHTFREHVFCYQEAMKSTDTLYWYMFRKKTAYPIRCSGKSSSVNGWQKLDEGNC